MIITHTKTADLIQNESLTLSTRSVVVGNFYFSNINYYDYPLLYIFWYQVVDAEAINILSNRLSIYLLLNL